MEECTLLAEMAAAGIARKEGAGVPWQTTFMPFAASVMPLLGQRSQMSIASKARALLLKSPVSNKLSEHAGVTPQGPWVGGARQPTVLWTNFEELTLLAEMEASGIARKEGVKVPSFSPFMPFAANVTDLFGARSQSCIATKVRSLLLNGPVANERSAQSLLQTSELRRGDLKNRRSVRWIEPEERALLAAMAAAGFNQEEGADVPGYSTFMPFAATAMHLFGHRSQLGIAKKVRTLLVTGPAANTRFKSAGSGASGLVGVTMHHSRRSLARPLPLPAGAFISQNVFINESPEAFKVWAVWK
jgi:hypothetical protein